MRKLFVVLAVVTAAVSAGCGGDGDNEAQDQQAEESTETGAQDFTVLMEPQTDELVVEWTTYFPKQLKVHPGDHVEYRIEKFSGVPHTVTLGTLIDQGLAASAGFTLETPIGTAEKALADLKVPDAFPHGIPAGPPLMNQSAAQPCYLAQGTPPFNEGGGAPACPEVAQPEFDGTQAMYNSGLMNDSGETFDVTLADTIKPGTYNLMCLVHRQPMNGQITVVPASETIPGPEEATTAGKAQRDDLVKRLEPLADKVRAATPDQAVAGTADPAVMEAIVAEFGPEEASIPVGGTVTWNTFAFHSIAFNAEDSDVGLVQKAADGSWVLFEKAGIPVGFKAPPEAGQFPPGPDPITIDGGAWDGAGFRTTGLIASLPPQFVTVKQKFTKAGTYTVRCQLHPDMKGQVKVG